MWGGENRPGCVSCPGQHPTLPTLPPGTGGSGDSASLPPTPPRHGDLANTRPTPKFGHSQPCLRDGAKGGAGELFWVQTKNCGGHEREAMTGLAGLGPSVWAPSTHATLPSPQSALSPTSAETMERQRRKWRTEAETGAGVGRGEANAEPGTSPSSEAAAERTQLSGLQGEGAVGLLLQDRRGSCGPREACRRGYLRAVGSLCHGDLLPVRGSASASNSHKARQKAGGLRGGSQRVTWGLSRPLGWLPLE